MIVRMLAVFLAMSLCTAAQAVSPQSAVEHTVDAVIVPGYDAFASSADTLAIRLDAYCAHPAPDAMDAAQAAWREAMTAWQRVSLWRFGPAREGTPALEWRIDSHLMPGGRRTDAMRRGIAQAVGAEGLALTAELLQQQNVFGRGLPVLEYLLFDTQTSARLPTEPRICDYLVAAGADLAVQAQTLALRWRGPAREALLAGAEGVPPLDTLVNALINGIDGLKRAKLEAPVRRGTLDPTALESHLSGQSLENIIANLDGVAALLGDVDGQGILALVATDDKALAMRLAADLDAARAAIAAIAPPLARAYADDADALQTALRALTVVHHDLRLDLVRALGVRPAFNEADGD